jgi:DNA-binding SARP family transcriptional activator
LPADIELLRRLGRRSVAIRTAGDFLARRHAKHVKINDLGAVRMRIGEQDVPRATVRRKVLALVTYLLARREWVATKEEVLDALWPELGPETATNSLNQTIYFLRRVFEPGYREETSPAYVRFDGETVGLDGELIEATSETVRQLTARYRRLGSSEDLDLLVELYAAKFALDFSYEDWAASYRESLHAAVLEAMERGISRALDHGDLHKAIHLAQRVLAVDPEADEVELKLISLYRRSGAYAAAAEQYAHYSSFVRDELGGSPPPLDSL